MTILGSVVLKMSEASFRPMFLMVPSYVTSFNDFRHSLCEVTGSAVPLSPCSCLTGPQGREQPKKGSSLFITLHVEWQRS